ncbi:MAG: DNA-processing protein DprA [Prevotella sp.]|nr:DNA-processing protein DprA [Prevotella sp.]
MSDETLYTMALTRMLGFNYATALQLYRELGGGRQVYDHRNDIGDVMPDASPRLRKALQSWDDAIARAQSEMAFMEQKHIRALTMTDDDYPLRLRDCPDAPLVLYYRGTANLNQQRIIAIVGTRHSTNYGHDLTRRFVADLRQMCPEVIVVSGLAYGIDICAHRNALQQGYETVGVLAHGLDQLYPNAHRQTAVEMLAHGGLLTEFMSHTNADKPNFVRRNRIVAGMSDATIIVESAAKGGGLITCEIARSYNRDVFAFPGAVGAPASEGCNNLIRDNGAALITSAEDFVRAMAWPVASERPEAVERQLFPELTADEQRVLTLLQQAGDLQLNLISVRTNIPIHQLNALLFQLEMKGLVRPMAGGCYHLLR